MRHGGIAFIGLLVALAVVPFAHADTLVGQASVIDGDTIEIHGERVRLWGIDAPESGQTCGDWRCGQHAANELAAWLGERTVICTPLDTDRFGRIVAMCGAIYRSGDEKAVGQDIGSWLVQHGWALDYERYSNGTYASEQAEAQAARRGIWATEFIEPWRWRRGQR
jgi:endonuclease YncB( thermonuclease family)